MNKNVIDNSISIAYEAINKAGISNNGRINKSYRGQISTCLLYTSPSPRDCS